MPCVLHERGDGRGRRVRVRSRVERRAVEPTRRRGLRSARRLLGADKGLRISATKHIGTTRRPVWASMLMEPWRHRSRPRQMARHAYASFASGGSCWIAASRATGDPVVRARITAVGSTRSATPSLQLEQHSDGQPERQPLRPDVARRRSQTVVGGDRRDRRREHRDASEVQVEHREIAEPRTPADRAARSVPRGSRGTVPPEHGRGRHRNEGAPPRSPGTLRRRGS